MSQACASFKDYYHYAELMTYWVHRYLLPVFEHNMQKGVLKKGRKYVLVQGLKCYYEGYLDQNN